MPADVTLTEYRALAEFRYQLRRFLRFSEDAATEVGVEPRQHQLLLAVRGIPPGVATTVGTLAERLQLRHHSTVELIDRCEERGLVVRRHSGTDRRQVIVAITTNGERLLRKLSVAHRTELRSVGRELLRSLVALMRARTSGKVSRGAAA